MNYQNHKKQRINKILSYVSAVAFLCLSLFTVFYSNQDSSAQASLPDCKYTAGEIRPGDNCLFYGMKLCQTVPTASYGIPPSSIFVGSAQHRVNCADLSDMPLCTQMDGPANPIKDCVKECSDPGFDGGTGVRGIDYAVHNRDCVRFCDAVEAGITPSPDVNCTSRKCHQLPDGIDPTAINCSMYNCNLLTPDEMNEVKFDNATKKYCEGDNLKCFEFTEAQIPFIRIRATNTMCKIHNCRATSETCAPFDTDEVQQILDKGASYTSTYVTYINSGYDLISGGLCTAVVCKPIITTQYRCTPLADDNPTTLNASCDATLPCLENEADPSGPMLPNASCNPSDTCSGGVCPQICIGNYCKKIIDCNLPANSSAPECATVPGNDYSNTFNDDTDSWFYRPKPMNKAVHANGLLKSMAFRPNDNPRICHYLSNIDTNNYGDEFCWPFGMGCWYFLDYLVNDTISPGYCSTYRQGSRGFGYIYLAGVNGSIYNKPHDYAGYIKGYVQSAYEEGEGTHNIEVCLRYNNAMIPQESRGSRECGVTIIFGHFIGQVCGYDVCKNFAIKDSDPKKCAIENTPGAGGCSSTIDTYVRARSVKYGNYICSFIDMKGTLAYDAQYFDGSEKLANGICISGENSGNGSCLGSKNTNSTPGMADVWRTLMMIPYIQNNRPSGPRGYLDYHGRLFEEQECPKVSYRITPPRLFNLANISNSQALFSPPVYIINSRVKRGGAISLGNLSSPLGPTDFHFPEVEVRFGGATRLLSLGMDFTGYEDEGLGDPQGSASISTTVNGFDYTAEVFVRKEIDVDNAAKFCLYQKIKDENGIYIAPLRISCVKRKLPEIDNTAEKATTPTIDLRKLLIQPSASSSYEDPEISIRYLTSSSATASNCSSPSTQCTNEILLTNEDQSIPTCQNDSEEYNLCVQREECSRLNIECARNEVDINEAINAGNPIDSLLAIRRNCNEILLPICNAKKGIFTTGASISDFEFNDPQTNPQYYGWFNETCIVEGFDHKIEEVIASVNPTGGKGKCVIDPASPYLTDANPSTNCDQGGKAPNCLCVKYVEGIELGANYEIRDSTFREIGLCTDNAIPQTCPVIDYNTSPNPDINDPEYIASSLNNSVYGVNVADIIGKVHISHKYRNEGKPAPNAIPLKGHAEFPRMIFGTQDVSGECKGFWTYQRSLSGATIRPKLNCENNNGVAEWEDDARDACIRYKCEQVFTTGPDINGFYQGGYGILETGEDKGLSNGFAMWPAYTKTNDFLETVNATTCIPGFKKVGASTMTSSGSVSESNAVTASLYALITGYSGGTSPTRQCNQLGQFSGVSNACLRISCPAINPPNPSGPGDDATWELWRNSGGASFPSVNASRSNIQIQPESISTGTCNETLGFFKSPGGGGQNPTRRCDYLGNWLPVENPCNTRCDDVTTDEQGSSHNNGFSKWTVPNSTKKIKLYQHCPYQGWSQEFEVGNYPSLPSNRHDASSITIDPGLKVTLYTGTNFSGTAKVLTGNLSCFTQISVNDNVRSMKVELNGPETLPAEFGGCITGYITNPYPPFLDAIGNPLSPEIANDLTRLPENPMRTCVIHDSGDGYFTSYWSAVINGCINKCPGAAEDSRVGVGVTQHSISSGSTIALQWPSTPFGQDAFLSNFDENIDASYFLSGRNNGYYLVKRHCNADGRWSDPQPMCAANNGQVGNARYDLNPALSGYRDSIAAGEAAEIVNGVCVSGYWGHNYNAGPLPQRTCQFEAGNNFIDKTFLTLANSTNDCEEERCPAFSQTKTLRSLIPAVAQNDNRTKVNGQIVGSCLNNTTNSANATVYTTLASGSLAPYVQCNPGGTWSGIIGDANCKHGCNFNGLAWGVNHGGCGDGMGYSYNFLYWDDGPVYSGFNMAHGQKLVFAGTDDCDGWCDALTLAFYCNDGTPVTRSIWDNNPAQWQCRFYNYDPATDSFSGFNVNHGSWSYFITGPGYVDKFGVPRNISLAVWD